MGIDADGYTRFELGERRYIGRTIAGKKAIGLYHRLQRLLEVASREPVNVSVNATPEERRGEFILVLLGRLASNPEILPLVDETLDGYAIERPGFPALQLPRDIDEAYRGRPSEQMTAAARVWNIEGFFQMPGAQSTPAPEVMVSKPPGDTV